MSVRQQLENSGLFYARRPQVNDSVCFSLRHGQRGASIYVLQSDRVFEIRLGALENQRFPNSQRLYDFVLDHNHSMRHGRGNSAESFQLDGELIDQVIEIIRSGM